MQAPKISFKTIGTEQQPLWVIDNFFAEPDSLFSYAMSSSPVSEASGHYPGMRSPASAQYKTAVLALVGKLINQFDASVRLQRIDAYYSLVATPPEQLNIVQRIPHFDKPLTNEYAVIHFLCGEEQGGTAFYQHRSTEFEFITEQRQNRYLASLERDIKQQGMPQGYINGDSDLFRQIHSEKAFFNRALVYRCSSLHSGCIARDYVPVFDPNKGRFTLTSFLG